MLDNKGRVMTRKTFNDQRMFRCLLFVVLCFFVFPGVYAHPLPTDDLLRPQFQVLSQSPISIVVTLKPRQDVLEVSIETPNNVSGPLVQCSFGKLVKDQIYTCRLSGSADSSDSVFTVVANAVAVEADGHRHLSSRSFSVNNPVFNIEEFREERRQEAKSAKSAGRAERSQVKK
jgi:hypothetical protein